MYVKITNDQPVEFPYTIGQFRRDNPQTSFPKVIPDAALKRNLVHPVIELPKPAYDPLVQDLVMDEMPHKEVIRLKTEQDATNPFTGEVDQEQVGQPIYGNRWFVGYTVESKPQDVAEAAVRDKRDALLAQADWVSLKAVDASSDGFGIQIPQEWLVYRQALRDITNHVNFPYLGEDDWPVKP